MKPYLADLHTHSIYSDGLSSPKKIIETAVKHQIPIIALTDHDTITGWPSFERAAIQVQNAGATLLAILGVEISTKEGHMLVYFPNRDQAENFSTQYVPHTSKKSAGDPWALDLIKKTVTDFAAICVIAHPGFNLISSFPLAALDKLAQELPPDVKPYVGVEVYNWMTQVFFWQYGRNTRQTQKLTRLHDLAQFSQSDAHWASHVGKGATEIQMTDLTSESFTNAVQNRWTSPHRIGSGKGKEFSESAAVGSVIHVINTVKAGFKG